MKLYFETRKGFESVMDCDRRMSIRSSINDNSINFIVRPWVNSSDVLSVKYSILEQIKKRFDEEGISIPYPQRDVHIYNHDIKN